METPAKFLFSATTPESQIFKFSIVLASSRLVFFCRSICKPTSLQLCRPRLRMASSAADIEIPDGFRLHTENTSHILLDADAAFLNPVQEFNRDMSVATIRVWSEESNKAKEEKWKKAQLKKASQKRAKQVAGK